MASILHEGEEEHQQQQQQQNEQQLPEDAVCEILTRVPLLELTTQCRLVCEEWENFLHESYLQELHYQRTNPVSGFIVQTQRRCKYYINYVSNNPGAIDHSSLDNFRLSEDMAIVASSPSGVLCCIDYSMSPIRYHVCRPANGECRPIPNPKTSFPELKVMIIPTGFDPLRYKIIRFSGLGPAYHCEIFNSDQKAWKQFHDVKLPDDVYFDCTKQPGVFVNGLLHCLTSNETIFVINVEDGSWRTIGLPMQQNTGHRRIEKKLLVEYNGNVGVVLVDDNCCIETWVLLEVLEYHEDDELNHTPLWMMEIRVQLPDDLRGFSILNLNSDNDVVVMTDHFDSIVWFNLKTSAYTRVQMDFNIIGSTFHPVQVNIQSCL